MGYEEAAINTGYGQEIIKDIRNNDRVFFDDFDLAGKLFHKRKPYVPKGFNGWKVHGLNERFRFYRYQPGQYFKWHRDGSYQRNSREESKITFMVYLNDDYIGGKTEFRHYQVSPKVGAALVFPHPLMHQGASIEQGEKYILRTDVMYQIAF